MEITLTPEERRLLRASVIFAADHVANHIEEHQTEDETREAQEHFDKLRALLAKL